MVAEHVYVPPHFNRDEMVWPWESYAEWSAAHPAYNIGGLTKEDFPVLSGDDMLIVPLGFRYRIIPMFSSGRTARGCSVDSWYEMFGPERGDELLLRAIKSPNVHTIITNVYIKFQAFRVKKTKTCMSYGTIDKAHEAIMSMPAKFTWDELTAKARQYRTRASTLAYIANMYVLSRDLEYRERSWAPGNPEFRKTSMILDPFAI